ncbi:hypothetical protein A3F29_00260 [Candidatus Roizmanbacteria bacterium RIFCSPHIGHO2_12_FULL_33_9]|uniref:Glycosyltransferase RgtA/B/C/D-like domain-containing protein n=1 Tax=Candidatus Roizmanbacteria bacterium RIFCSPHIGHO2_12_FULL_33_9 TaxID=1802045 RepID=A0A1F7HKH2_9BACT|nr:MAG: hypothetical protein A3F29_00260 [Candidatus Roizmanbacteria bacterium RIFCSPHIGHO2_12_FULL_33_9]
MKLKWIFIILIFALGFTVRLYKFNAPIADWHSWRQTDTSAVSVFFVEKGFDLLHPRYYDLSNVPSGVHDNPEGYRFVEFPIYNLFQGGLFKIFGFFTIEQWGRLVTIFSSLVSAFFIFLIVKKYLSERAGLIASFFYLFIPFNIYFSRVILPDQSMVTAVLGGVYFFDVWIEDKKFSIFNFQFLIALIFTAAALLLKPFAVFFMLPMLYLAFEKFGLNFLKKWQLWFFAITSVLPLVLWRLWEFQYPGGIPQSGWLLNGGNIRFKGAFFYWIFGERVGKLILGYWGLPLLIFGLIHKIPQKSYFFFLSFLASSLLYITVVARGNVQHDYYQILIIPSISIFLALGTEYLLNIKENHIKFFPYLILIILSLFMLFFGWYYVRDFYTIQHESFIRAGREIDKLIPKDAKVIVPNDGDTTPLYFIKRQGWASFEKEMPQMIKMGADYIVLLEPKEENFNIKNEFKIISYSKDYILVDLHQKQ